MTAGVRSSIEDSPADEKAAVLSLLFGLASEELGKTYPILLGTKLVGLCCIYSLSESRTQLEILRVGDTKSKQRSECQQRCVLNAQRLQEKYAAPPPPPPPKRRESRDLSKPLEAYVSEPDLCFGGAIVCDATIFSFAASWPPELQKISPQIEQAIMLLFALLTDMVSPERAKAILKQVNNPYFELFRKHDSINEAISDKLTFGNIR